MNAPTLSIILPVWNGEKYLRESIPALLSQTFLDFELIIVNDCSTDSTAKIIEDYAKKDDRIRVIHNQINLKLPASLNVGHRAAKGSYLTWTSDDNNAHPRYLEHLYSAITREKVDIVYSDYTIINENGIPQFHNTMGNVEELIYTNTIGASFLYRKEVFEKLNGYNENLFLIEDYDFWVRAYLAGFKFKHLNFSLYDYRVHSQSLSSTQRANPTLIPYLMSVRTQFKGIDRKHLFKARTSLIFNGRGVLSNKDMLLLFWEAWSYHPIKVIWFGVSRWPEFIKRKKTKFQTLFKE